MNETGKNIVTQLAAQLSLHDKTKEELEAIVQRYPYFAFARFLLSCKIKDEQDPNAEKQIQKTALYFFNPFWFHYLATDNELYIVHSSNENLSPVEHITEEPAKENITTPADNPIGDSEQPTDEYQDEPASDLEIDSVDTSNKKREKLSKLIEQHLSEFKKPVEDNGEMAIETRVYHTIDYFASQGIRLESGRLSPDTLELKVKKFTDWLKQMKHAGQNPTDLGTDTETEHLIEKIAQTSNETKDIITETMAQVLLKQGKTEKAIQLYKKLSFLNPSKSTYFAAKINELKGLQ
jgi:hypothetical protein